MQAVVILGGSIRRSWKQLEVLGEEALSEEMKKCTQEMIGHLCSVSVWYSLFLHQRTTDQTDQTVWTQTVMVIPVPEEKDHQPV